MKRKVTSARKLTLGFFIHVVDRREVYEPIYHLDCTISGDEALTLMGIFSNGIGVDVENDKVGVGRAELILRLIHSCKEVQQQ